MPSTMLSTPTVAEAANCFLISHIFTSLSMSTPHFEMGTLSLGWKTIFTSLPYSSLWPFEMKIQVLCSTFKKFP